MIPAAAAKLAAVLALVLPSFWSTMPAKEILMGQSEQETCMSLKSPRCLNPHTENKAGGPNQEYGFGVFQLTNTRQYNNFEMMKRQVPALRNWQWSDRFNLQNQVIAGVVMDRGFYQSCSRLMKPGRDSVACMLSSYNGGFGGFQADRRLCGNTKGCDPTVWFGNVEQVSTKSKKPRGTYSVSAYQINREYVKNIWYTRSSKYKGMVK
jgi:hypothetical protein